MVGWLNRFMLRLVSIVNMFWAGVHCWKDSCLVLSTRLMVGREVLLWWVSVADWSGTGSRGAFIVQRVVGHIDQSESSGRDY